MEKTETFEAFHNDRFSQQSDLSSQMQFNILSHSDCENSSPIQYRRRDFYKVSFLKGHYILHYGDKSLEVNGLALAFFKPDVPYTVEILEESTTGGYFVFREAYFNDYYRSNIRDLPLFANGSKPIYLLDKSQGETVDKIFKKMWEEMGSDYAFKHDLIRNFIVELIHFSLKMQPSEILYHHIDAKTRITAVFHELLDRQFPIESTTEEVSLRSASDFADKLGVHVNYLNRAVRATTGKTTTEHISERLTSEAILLLKHSHWNISEISYSLGFEDPSHFNHFFKKQTNQIPSSFRI
jgi:AraC family transcriptional activator of pobA